MYKSTLIVFSIVMLTFCCSEIKKDEDKKSDLIKMTETLVGLREYLQGMWCVHHFSKDKSIVEIQRFAGDTLIFKSYRDNGNLLNKRKIRIEYFSGHRISGFNEQSKETLCIKIENPDSFWTVLGGDYPLFYSRLDGNKLKNLINKVF